MQAKLEDFATGYSVTVQRLALQELLRFVGAIQATGRSWTATTMALAVSS